MKTIRLYEKCQSNILLAREIFTWVWVEQNEEIQGKRFFEGGNLLIAPYFFERIVSQKNDAKESS